MAVTGTGTGTGDPIVGGGACDGFCQEMIILSHQSEFYNLWSDDGDTYDTAAYLCSIGFFINTITISDFAWYDAVCTVLTDSYINTNFYGESPSSSQMLPHVLELHAYIMEQEFENEETLFMEILAQMANICGSGVEGCDDVNANNYNENATINNGTCEYTEIIQGCTNSNADNYNPDANEPNGSCVNWEMGVVSDDFNADCPYIDFAEMGVYYTFGSYKSFQTIGVNSPTLSMSLIHNSTPAEIVDYQGNPYEDGFTGNYNSINKSGGVLEFINHYKDGVNLDVLAANEQAVQFRIDSGTLVDVSIFAAILNEAIPSAAIKDIEGYAIMPAYDFYGFEELTSELVTDTVFEFSNCPNGVIAPSVPNYNLYSIVVPNAEGNVMAALADVDFSAAFSLAALGCTDVDADNYDSSAAINDGSCYKMGCTNPDAENFDFSATTDDGSCSFSGDGEDNKMMYILGGLGLLAVLLLMNKKK